jgi:hypothetical protein
MLFNHNQELLREIQQWVIGNYDVQSDFSFRKKGKIVLG